MRDTTKNSISQWLLQHSTNGKINHGAKKEAAEFFSVDVKTIWRIWKAVLAQQALGLPVYLKAMSLGSTHKDKLKVDVEKVKKLSVAQRSSLRVMACNLGVSKSLVHVWVKDKKLRAHTNAIKPFLTPQNKLSRLNWSLSQLSSVSEGGLIKFQPMYNTIHIDEKWFYLTKTKDRYYLAPDEIEPHRTCKSKRYIPKIMFMCAVSRPIIDAEGKILFDGKFGIFPFITEEPAKRNSKNRCKSTMEVRPIAAITKAVIKNCLIKQMIPTFKAKWPEGANKPIFIQQDNAKPHIKADDPEFIAVARADGYSIHLVCQPANSPDTNVNDRGFFRAIQTLKDQKPAKDVAELLQNVKDSYEEYPPEKLNHVFLTLQECYHEIIKTKGDNNYKISHMNKERLARLGILPTCIEVEEELVRDSLEYLYLQENHTGETSNNVGQLVEGLQQMAMTN